MRTRTGTVGHALWYVVCGVCVGQMEAKGGTDEQ
eukprot:COSAG02_NODE_541_length_20598_cov_278.953754_8_plen_34_part_00